MTSDELDSYEHHAVYLIDHQALFGNHQLQRVITEIYSNTGMMPGIELRNAHTGQNACFIALTLIDAEYTLNLTTAYDDTDFGFRLTHMDLGDGYHKLIDAINKIASGYEKLLTSIKMMQQTRLDPQMFHAICVNLEKILFRRPQEVRVHIQKEFYDLYPKFMVPSTLWQSVFTIQKKLKNGIPYTHIRSGRSMNKKIAKPDRNGLYMRRENAIMAQVFELCRDLLPEN
jgi:hypothetical protein